MYDILSHSATGSQQAANPYDPFPSLKKLGASSAAPGLSRPPLPPPRSNNDHVANNYRNNPYDPFPSLNNMPEFYSSPSYMNNKFRKTKLW